MWLTNSGGLFYFSQQYGEPLGCNITSLSVRVPQTSPIPGRYLLEVVAEEGAKVHPTVLATETVEERDAWFRSVLSVQEKYEEKGGGDKVDPLEPLIGNAVQVGRSRLSTQPCLAEGDAAAIAAAGNGRPSSPTKSEASSSTGVKYPSERDSNVRLNQQRAFASQVKAHGRASYQATRASLVNRASQCGTVAPPEPNVARMASIGPSVFSRRSLIPTLKRHDSQGNFNLKSNTVLVLDWDDTIFPTTFVRKDCGLDWRYPMEKQVRAGPALEDLKARLETLSDKVTAFLELACSLAYVVIVTLAKNPWVHNSSGNFMPRLRDLINEKQLKIIYARDKITQQAKQAYFANAFKTSQDEAEFWMKAKARAMEQEFESVHNALRISWKNIISFGDSDFERVALVHTADEYVRKESEGATVKETGLTSELVTKNGHRKRVRAKTLKMLEEPSCEEMIAQIALMHLWLPHIVKRDEGLDLELSDSTNDNELHDINYILTGKAGEELSWKALVGIDGDGMVMQER
jgi:hypothetical protein